MNEQSCLEIEAVLLAQAGQLGLAGLDVAAEEVVLFCGKVLVLLGSLTRLLRGFGPIVMVAKRGDERKKGKKGKNGKKGKKQSVSHTQNA